MDDRCGPWSPLNRPGSTSFHRLPGCTLSLECVRRTTKVAGPAQRTGFSVRLTSSRSNASGSNSRPTHSSTFPCSSWSGSTMACSSSWQPHTPPQFSEGQTRSPGLRVTPWVLHVVETAPSANPVSTGSPTDRCGLELSCWASFGGRLLRGESSASVSPAKRSSRSRHGVERRAAPMMLWDGRE